MRYVYESILQAQGHSMEESIAGIKEQIREVDSNVYDIKEKLMKKEARLKELEESKKNVMWFYFFK